MTKITVDEALIEQAIYALTNCVGDTPSYGQVRQSTIMQLRTALAEPVVEPVAWVLSHSRGIEFSSKYPIQASRYAAEQMARQHMGETTVTPLYTSPQPPAEVPAVKPDAIGCKCSICGEWQRWTPGGMVCKNGHGGADGINHMLYTSPAERPMLTDDEIDVALHVAIPSLSYASEAAFIEGVRVGEALARQKAGLK